MATLTAQRLALHGVGRLRGGEVVEWARRALELAGPDDPVRVEALALLGLGLGWVGLPGAPHDAPTADDALVARAGATLAVDVDESAARAAVASRRARADACGLGVVRGVVVRVVGAGGVRGGGVG